MAAAQRCQAPHGPGAWPRRRVIPLAWKYSGRYAVSRADKAAGRKERKVTGRELLILNYAPPAAPA